MVQPSFHFSSICIFWCVSLPLRLLQLAAAWCRSWAPLYLGASSWKSPRAESWALLPLSYLEHRFALLVIFWRLWITIMLSYWQLRSSWWERSQLLEAFSMRKKKVWFQPYSLEMLFVKAFTWVWDAGNNFNRQCIILLFGRNFSMCWRVKEPVITGSYR